MARLAIFALAVASLVVPARADTTFYRYAFSKQYIVSISREAMERTPSWKADAENPPVSARTAMKLANGMKDTLVKDSEDFKWTLKATSLQPAGNGKWYWLVHYDAEFPGSTGIPNHLRLVVLMDGTAIQPVVKDDP